MFKRFPRSKTKTHKKFYEQKQKKVSDIESIMVYQKKKKTLEYHALYRAKV